jgi:CheY-like chemotaxis protein
MIGEPAVVLLVEDNDDHAELVLRQMSSHQIANKVIRLVDGQEALDYLFRKGNFANPDSSPRPHVIFLDLRLPKVDGLKVLKTLKESGETRDIPIVVLTTSAGKHDVAMAYMNYTNSYVVKPVDYKKFRDLMDKLGYYWMSWNTTVKK